MKGKIKAFIGHRRVKIFGGKRYHLKGTAYNKADAELMVADARKGGHSARICKRVGKSFGYGREPKYGIYIR